MEHEHDDDQYPYNQQIPGEYIPRQKSFPTHITNETEANMLHLKKIEQEEQRNPINKYEHIDDQQTKSIEYEQMKSREQNGNK
jgi:hypothetical protein